MTEPLKPNDMIGAGCSLMAIPPLLLVIAFILVAFFSLIFS
jgi:hypothetical protein